MGGILACYGHHVGTRRKEFVKAARRLRHRGPDWSGCHASPKAILANELLIVDKVKDAEQPAFSEDRNIAVVANAELYNHEALCKQLDLDSQIDVSNGRILIALYQRYQAEMVNFLNGVFAFALYDQREDFFLVARDPVGVVSLYQGWDPFSTDAAYFASEMKALEPFCHDITPVHPGSIYCSKGSPFRRFYKPTWWQPCSSSLAPRPKLDEIRAALTEAVVKRLPAEAPYGLLLSGGLDCALITSIAVGESRRTEPGAQVHSFAIGLEGDPQLVAAQQVADFVGTTHHSFVVTENEGLDAVLDTIYHLESFDVATVRASVMMFLLARKVKSLGIKVVLNGDGSDAIFAGYEYLRNTPDADSLQNEIVQNLREIHHFDSLRAHKTTMAWGLQCRVPFLDTNMLDLACSISPADKLVTEDRIEKHVLRQAFDVYKEDYQREYLPKAFLWQEQERCISDVDERWINALKSMAVKAVPRVAFENKKTLWPTSTPDTVEA
ncbi:MAG: hypothetical protein Q9184_004477 [Pyrenodesmia sp. 2 TL-2023]